MTATSARCLAVLFASVCLWACQESVPDVPRVRIGESLTGLSDGERGRFLLGRALFERLATQDEGLGPLFNAERCSDCHDVPVVGGGGVSIPVLKATRLTTEGCDPLRGAGGDNIQLRATELLRAHGLGPETVPAEATASVYVVAPPLFGLGLIEAVPDSVLEALADPDDRDGNGVSGRLPRTADGRVARFGRKGDAASIEDFIETALLFELGFTTPDLPAEEVVNGIRVPPGADPMPDPEIDAEALGLLTDYVGFLAPPAPEGGSSRPTADSIAAGREAFLEAGCAACHVPEMRTGPGGVEALVDQRIQTYSDLLLHDLGAGSEDVCGRDAAPGEYRTAPLWGLRHRNRFMHDGGAADLTEAIAAHGGEGEASRARFAGLPPARRALLIRFLSSL